MNDRIAPFLVTALVAVLWTLCKEPTTILHGHVDREFGKVRDLFSDMIQRDDEGASLAVLYQGKLVLHLYGGYANRRKGIAWNKDTMAVAYSSTKIWAGLTAAILAGRGLLNYTEKVSTFWPEYSKNGKESTTVRDILDHRAGLITFGRDFTLDEAKDPDGVSTLIETATPHWVPGTSRGYHALTYGFLVDQMIRRLHPRHYTVSQFYQKEVWREGIAFSIGSGNLNQSLIALVSNPSILQSVAAHAKRPLTSVGFIAHITGGGLAMTSASYPHFLGIMRMDSVPYNEPAVRELPLVSCMGIGTAAGFAEALHQVISKKMIPDSLCKNISEPTATEEDIVLNKKVSFGHGFLYAPHPVRKGEWIIRILGNGLQAVEMDFKEDVIIVMLRNGLRAGEDGEDDYEAISEAVHHTVHDIRRNSDRLL